MTTFTLGDWFEGGHAKMDLQRLLTARLLLQAGSGFGKSWALRRILEQTAGGVQQFIIDPEGEFATLREKHDYVIAAVNGGDALAHPRTAGLLLRRLMETGVSAILDISELKKAERRRFVRLFIEELMQLPRSMWSPVLVVADECHEYAPEKDEAESLAAIVDLATRGRKRGFALLAATQRIGKLSKDVAAELHNKLIGFTSLDIDVKRAAFELGLTPKDAQEQLRACKPGDFHAFGPAISGSVRRLHIGDVKTTHPEPGTKKFRPPPTPTAAIKAVLPKLADLPKEAEEEARTVEDLRRELASVKRQLASKPAPAADKATVERAVRGAESRLQVDQKKLLAGRDRQIAALREALGNAMKLIVNINAQDFFGKDGAKPDQEKLEAAIRAAMVEVERQVGAKLDGQHKAFEAWRREGQKLLKRIEALLADGEMPVDVTVRQQTSITVERPATVKHSAQLAKSSKSPISRTNGAGEQLPASQQKILDKLAWLKWAGIEPAPKETLAAVCGVSPTSGGYFNNLGKLRSAGLIDYPTAGAVAFTEAGEALANPPEDDGRKVHEHWLNVVSGPQRKILEVLIETHPNEIAKDELAQQIGVSPTSGGYFNNLGRLRTLGAVDYPSPGKVALTRYVMP